MNDFQYYTPTKVVFGRGTEEQAGQLVKEQGGTRALVHFGGRSARESGLLDRVLASLDRAGVAHVELGGVVPNPRLSKVREGMELCRREGVDFLLAVELTLCAIVMLCNIPAFNIALGSPSFK